MRTHKIFSLFTLLFMIALTVFMVSALQKKAKQDRAQQRVEHSQMYRQAQKTITAHTIPAPCGHSVVCGGVHSSSDLANAMKSPAVRTLYSSSSTGSWSFSKTDRAFFAYNSYRIGGKIYWTKRPRLIPVGEDILMDGDGKAILVRCGNLVSLTPQTPTRAVYEPTDLYPPTREWTEPTPPEVLLDTTAPPSIFDTSLPTAPAADTPQLLALSYIPVGFPALPAPRAVNTPEPSVRSQLVFSFLCMLFGGLIGLIWGLID